MLYVFLCVFLAKENNIETKSIIRLIFYSYWPIRMQILCTLEIRLIRSSQLFWKTVNKASWCGIELCTSSIAFLRIYELMTMFPPGNKWSPLSQNNSQPPFLPILLGKVLAVQRFITRMGGWMPVSNFLMQRFECDNTLNNGFQFSSHWSVAFVVVVNFF